MSQREPLRRILGIDPGTATTGYGIIDHLAREEFAYVTSGIIETPKHLSAGERLKMIRSDLLSLLGMYKPNVLAVEAVFFFKNAKTLVPVAQARGVILEAAASMSILSVDYTPMQVKLNLTGFGRAEKLLVQEMVAKLLNHSHLIKPDDAADALALAICHARVAL